MLRITILTILFLAGWTHLVAQQKYVLPKGVADDQIQPGILVFKLKQGSRNYERNDYAKSDLPFKAKSLSPLRYRRSAQRNTKESSVLRGIYKVEVNQDEDILTLCNLLLTDAEIAYAEPIFKETLFYVPSDPQAVADGGAQNYLSVIRAYDAWEISQGSEDIIIGVIDTGADLDHEDLAGNLYVNEAEIINGEDDDNNGFIDDRTGYDFADEDADAQSDGSGHGSQVSGLAAADTDNGIGIAGLGFRSKLAPLKGFRTATSESSGNYDAIIYAADNGYDVINLSWGSINTFSQFNQDIINYAVLENDVVVVAAAGNSNSEVDFYPAAYDHVLAVGATELDDTKSSFATYGNFIDVSAPGSSIYSTTNDTYGNYWGSSFASPIVAGVAGLVRAHFPDLSAEEVMERIRVTADDIHASNPDYIGKLGRGRLNAFRALSETNLKSVRVRDFTVSGENGQTFYFGDSITINIELESLLSPTEQGNLTLSEENGHLNYLSEEINFGALSSTNTVALDEITAIISDEVVPGSMIDLRMDFEDGDYADFQQFSLTVAPDYLDLNGGQAALTIAGNGELAKVETGTAGAGLVLGTDLLASEIGLILTTGIDSVVDNAPVIFGQTKNSDFSVEQHVKPYQNTIASQYAFNTFGEQDTLGVKVEQSTMSWNELDSALVLSYRIINNSRATIDSLGLGLFINWELEDPFTNRATWDQVNTAFAFDEQSSVWAGYRILTERTILHSALDLISANQNIADFDSTFTDSLKYNYLVQENFDSAGFGGGNDVADLLGMLLTDFAANQTSEVSFIIGFGRDREEMEQRLENAESLLATFKQSPPLVGEEVSCEGGMIEISPPGGSSFNFYSDAAKQDTLGIGASFSFGPVNSDSVIFVSSADSTYEGPLRRIDIRFLEEIARFTASTETIYLGENNNIVTFTDQSFNPINWDWDFGNGNQASVRNPTVVYNEPGNYTVTLQVQNVDGCIGSFSTQLEVLYRPEPLGLNQLVACFGEAVSISAEEGNSIRIYDTPDSNTPSFEGSTFELTSITVDTLIYVSQVENGHESNKESIAIVVHEVQPEFSIITALDSASTDYLWLINNTEASISASWIVNGTTVEGDTVVFETSVEQLDVTLTVDSDFGCSGTTREIVLLSPAELPAYLPPSIICRGDSVVVKPTNGSYFGFFEADDPEGTLIKSETIVFDSLIQEVSLRIFGLDGGLPGDTLEVILSPNAFDFDILATPDTLYLDQDRSVDFSLDTVVFSPQWFVNDELTELVESPIFSFDTAGVYHMRAIGEDSDECVHIATRDYLVFAETPIVLSTIPTAGLSIFPNPARSRILIDVPFEIEKIYIFDLKGTLLFETKEKNRVPVELDVSFLKTGTYLIRVVLRNQVIVHKFRKE